MAATRTNDGRVKPPIPPKPRNLHLRGGQTGSAMVQQPATTQSSEQTFEQSTLTRYSVEADNNTQPHPTSNHRYDHHKNPPGWSPVWSDTDVPNIEICDRSGGGEGGEVGESSPHPIPLKRNLAVRRKDASVDSSLIGWECVDADVCSSQMDGSHAAAKPIPPVPSPIRVNSPMPSNIASSDSLVTHDPAHEHGHPHDYGHGYDHHRQLSPVPPPAHLKPSLGESLRQASMSDSYVGLPPPPKTRPRPPPGRPGSGIPLPLIHHVEPPRQNSSAITEQRTLEVMKKDKKSATSWYTSLDHGNDHAAEAITSVARTNDGRPSTAPRSAHPVSQHRESVRGEGRPASAPKGVHPIVVPRHTESMRSDVRPTFAPRVFHPISVPQHTDSVRSDSSGYASSEPCFRDRTNDFEDDPIYEQVAHTTLPSPGVTRAKISDVTHESKPEQAEPLTFVMTKSVAAPSDFSSDESEDAENSIYMNKDQLDVSTMYHKRENVATEILKTEELYVSRLETLHKACWQLDGANRAMKIVSKKDMKSMLPSVEGIFRLHRDHLLPELRGKMRAWKEEPNISEVWIRYTPMLKMYQTYFLEADIAIKSQNNFRVKNSALDAAFKDIEIQPEFKMLDMNSLMLEPIQRLPRYVLLLQAYKKYIPPSDSEYKVIGACIVGLEEVVGLCDSALKVHDKKRVNKSNA